MHETKLMLTYISTYLTHKVRIVYTLVSYMFVPYGCMLQPASESLNSDSDEVVQRITNRSVRVSSCGRHSSCCRSWQLLGCSLCQHCMIDRLIQAHLFGVRIIVINSVTRETTASLLFIASSVLAKFHCISCVFVLKPSIFTDYWLSIRTKRTVTFHHMQGL